MTAVSQIVSNLAGRVDPVMNSRINTNGRATALNVLGSNATSSSKTNSTATDSSGISSTDFLTLLVSELKNQDPTQPTDPNAYVQQLVGVNSLQQLIDINKHLTPSTSASATSSATSPVSGI